MAESIWMGKDEHEGVRAQPRKDAKPPPHWRLEASAHTPRPRSVNVQGGRAVFIEDGGDTSDLWLLDLEDGGRPRRLTTGRQPMPYWEDTQPRLSPDGAQVAYADGDHVWLVPTAGGPGEVFERVDPCSDDAVASPAFAASGEVVVQAVDAARAAAAGWAPYGDRCALLRADAAGIGDRRLALAAVASLETGKSRTESIIEIQEAIDLITTYADHMERNDGYVVALASFVESERNTDMLRPYGIFAVMIAGNTVVFKPSEETPWTGAIFEEIGAADLPPGVFNLVHGEESTGRALVAAPIDGVAFTGSAAVRRAIARAMQEGPYPCPALMEMGGKNPAIVAASAELDAAAEGVARAASFDEALAEANAPVYGLTAGIFSEDGSELDRFLDEIHAGVVYVNRRAGATTGAWPGTQTFCGWKSSGATGKGGLGPYHLAQFMREQSRTVVQA